MESATFRLYPSRRSHLFFSPSYPSVSTTLSPERVIGENPIKMADDFSCSVESGLKLLEPYTKDQLIEFLVDVAVKDTSLFDRISEAADRDVSHRKIFIHGLGWDTTRKTLASSFESYGEIEECNVVMDRATGKAKSYGFVLFKKRQGARKALKEPRKKINNRVTSCQLASVGLVLQQQSQDSTGRKIYVSNVQADADLEK